MERDVLACGGLARVGRAGLRSLASRLQLNQLCLRPARSRVGLRDVSSAVMARSTERAPPTTTEEMESMVLIDPGRKGESPPRVRDLGRLCCRRTLKCVVT